LAYAALDRAAGVVPLLPIRADKAWKV